MPAYSKQLPGWVESPQSHGRCFLWAAMLTGNWNLAIGPYNFGMPRLRGWPVKGIHVSRQHHLTINLTKSGRLPPASSGGVIMQARTRSPSPSRDRLFQPATGQFASQQVLFIIGGPGSGKGTHCAILSKEKGYCHISTGDLVRSRINAPLTGNENTEELAFKKAIAEKTARGEFLDDEFIVKIVRDEMLKHPEAPGFLIDGCPRTLGQAILFEARIKKCDLVLFFNTDEETMTRRCLGRGLVGHRSDDNLDTIKRRLKTYREQTVPVIDYLRGAYGDAFRELDSSGEVAEAALRVKSALDNRPAPKPGM